MAKKIQRAPPGSRDVLARIVQLAETPELTYTAAAKLLGISRRQLYSHRKTLEQGKPIKTVLARKSTVEKYQKRLASAAATVMAEQTTAKQQGIKPPKRGSQPNNSNYRQKIFLPKTNSYGKRRC